MVILSLKFSGGVLVLGFRLVFLNLQKVCDMLYEKIPHQYKLYTSIVLLSVGQSE